MLLSVPFSNRNVSYHVMYSVYDQYMKYGVFKYCLFFYLISTPAISDAPTVVSVFIWICVVIGCSLPPTPTEISEFDGK